MSDEEETITSIPPPDTGEIEFGDELPVLPIRNAVLFPAAVAPFDVGREKSVALVEDIENLDQPIIAIMAQRDPSTDDPDQSDLYPVGVAARVLKALKHSSGNYSLILQGLVRIRLEQVVTSEPYIRARVSRLHEPPAEDVESEALAMSLRDIAKQVIQLMPELPREAGSLIDSIQERGQLADLVAANLDAPVDEKSQLLETLDPKDRIRKVLRLLTRQLEILKMRERINSQIKEEMGKNQREYVLRQQLKAIKEELGEEEGDQGDLDVLEERMAKANLPTEADNVAHKQLKRLRQMQVGSAEYTVVRTYIDWILDIPWSKQTADNMDIAAVRKVLDEDHTGLEKVKKRIVEYLAVRKLKSDKKGPILCLIGPPGVGKTSLGRSVARAVGRKFHRISLGGVHDEAAIRGHRRTYVGALPGQVIQGMKKATTINPVFMLDEIDKVGHDFRGDPAAALLEVLDPEQNDTFSDHYLEIPYDLSKVMFIATGNVGDTIPAPLRDRMEIIEIPSYTRREKADIARVHLVPKQLEEHGIKAEQVTLEDAAIESIIDHYTREAGVRNLERQIASVIRGVAVKVAEGEEGPWAISDEESLRPYLGAPRFIRCMARASFSSPASSVT
jgi:ATP-dependent Lon protease